MKTKILSIIIFSLFFGGVVFAQDSNLPDPGMTPDSPFYFLERMMEATRTFFTFGDIRKAERHATLAQERLAEARAVVEKGKPEFMEKTLERYEMQLKKSMASAEKAMTGDKNTEKAIEVMSNAGKTTSVHMGVLAEAYEKVSEQARPAIENAMKASAKGHEKAVEVLKMKNALGEVPEVVSLPAVVPQEIRERIQVKAREELMVEKFLQGSETPRELCTKTGGPPELCEKISVDGFESFEALKVFFIEAGAPADQWPVAESKCKELGATTANKCFRILLISSSTAYASAEPRAVMAPSLSEQKMQQQRIQVGPEIQSAPAPVERRLKQRYIPGVSKVIIYLPPTCPYCTEAKEWLNEHNIEYEEIDISKSKAAGEELTTRTGSAGVLTVVMDNSVLVGFSVGSFSEFFGIE